MAEPKCSICGEDASHMIFPLGFLCDQCYTTNPLLMNASTRGMEKDDKQN